jgi:hypothetical protein
MKNVYYIYIVFKKKKKTFFLFFLKIYFNYFKIILLRTSNIIKYFGLGVVRNLKATHSPPLH